ncbi:MAG TPA: RsmB/NOP family class I SAM-dependent RNA methyltransferase [Magnetospirillaceae bacterium]
MNPSARFQAVLEVTDAVDQARAPADQVASSYFRQRRYIGSSDRRWISLQLWGLLRRRARLDWWLTGKHAPLDARRRLIADLVLDAKLPVTEISELFTGQEHAPERLSGDERALIGELAGQNLVHRGMAPWVKGEFPEWLTPSFQALFGVSLDAEMTALLDAAPVDLRVNTLKGTRKDAIAGFVAEGLHPQPTPFSPVGLRLSARTQLSAQEVFKSGLVEVQDEGSQLAALLLGAKPGESVVDYCAGAGGKTLAIAAQMENKGRLAALDIDKRRSDRAAERLRRAGVFNTTRHVLAPEGDPWIKRRASTIDRVLVDAPCTGSGTWRRNPDARWRLTQDDLARLIQTQAAILANAARLVKKGGRLVYVTCSLLTEENEAQIDAFLAAHPNFAVTPLQDAWAESVGGTCPVDGPYLRLTPARNGTDGFFAAVMTRSAA